MERTYWIDRKRAAMAMARGASTSTARLIHYELAGRYSIQAAQCLPFMLPKATPSEGERAVLQLPATAPASPRPGPRPGDPHLRRAEG